MHARELIGDTWGKSPLQQVRGVITSELLKLAQPGQSRTLTVESLGNI